MTADTWAARAAQDAELLAVLVALAPLGDRVTPWLDIAGRDFAAAAMLKQGSWSSGERILIEVARSLWRGEGPVDLAYIACGLSRSFRQAVMDAIAVRGRQDFTTDAAAAIAKALS